MTFTHLWVWSSSFAFRVNWSHLQGLWTARWLSGWLAASPRALKPVDLHSCLPGRACYTSTAGKRECTFKEWSAVQRTRENILRASSRGDKLGSNFLLYHFYSMGDHSVIILQIFSLFHFYLETHKIKVFTSGLWVTRCDCPSSPEK